MRFRERCGHAISLRLDGNQGNDQILIGQHVVHVDAEGTLGELHGALEEAADLRVAGVLARERTVPGNVPLILEQRSSPRQTLWTSGQSGPVCPTTEVV